MSENATSNPPDWAPWRELLQWAPFKIDALGLVTLLGAEQVNASVGRLVRSIYFEYFPLLGAFVIAGNTFRNKEAGFNLYNITQGIHTTDMAAWLTRWMQSQDFEANRSIVRWTVEKRHVSVWEHFASLAPSVCANGMLIAMTILSYDWYGFANAIAMVGSVVVRWYLLNSIRGAIDDRVLEAYKRSERAPEDTYQVALSRWEEKTRKSKAMLNGSDTENKGSTKKPHRLEFGWNGTEAAKVLIIMNDAKAVTMIVPRDLLAPPSVFIFNLDPPNNVLYEIARWLGWITFAVQVVTIGMADLATQIVTVFLLVFPTVLYIARLGCDDSRWWAKTKKLFSGLSHSNGQNPGPGAENYDWPELQSECWIGSMLKAEVYEWPWSHEFALDKDGNVRDDANYTEAERPISKRQHLYAWLQLSEEEKESIDKWDLFPHQRRNNTKWVDLYEKMTERTKALSKSQWTINALQGVLSKQVQPPSDNSSDEPQKQPHVLEVNTRLPKHQAAKSSKPPEEDTVDTAQDGTVLDHNSPSIGTSPVTIGAQHADPRRSVAFSSSFSQDPDNIKPLKKSYTEPLGARRHSVTTEPSGSAFWVTRRIAEQQESSEEACESDESQDIKTTKKSD